MGTNAPFEKQQPPEFERPALQPDLLDLDASLRRLSNETHPRPVFVARLRGDLEQKTAQPPRRRPHFPWTRPLFAQAVLLALLVGLVALALGLAPHLLASPTRMPGVQPVAGTPGPDGSRAGMLARLGKGAITALDANPDGLLAVAATTGVCVYDQGVREEWCAWTDETALAVAFNPGGDVLAVGLGDGRLQIRDARTGQIRAGRASSSMSSITSLAWDPAGAPVIASLIIGGQVTAWNWQEDALPWAPIQLPAPTAALAWAQGAGGESVLAAGGDSGLTLLDGETGLPKTQYDPSWQVSPMLGIGALDFSASAPGEQPWLAYAYRGGVAALKMNGWQASDTRNWPVNLDSPAASPSNASIVFSPPSGAGGKGLRLAAASQDGVRLIQVEDGTIQPPILSPVKTGTPLAWAREDSLFFTLRDGRLGRAPLNGDPLTVLQTGYTTFLLDLAWSDAGLVATNGPDEVRAWRTDGSQAGSKLLALGADAQSLALSPDGAWVACVLKNGGTLVLWDLTADRPAWTAELSAQERAVAFSPDSTKLAVAAEDGRVTAYAVQTGRVTAEVQAAQPAASIRDIAWAPPAYGYDAIAAAWELEGNGGIDLLSLDARLDWTTKQVVKNINPVTSLAWGPEGPGQAGLLAAFQAEQALLWDAESGAERYRIGETPQRQDVFIPTLAFSNDGLRLAVSSRAGISMWDLPDGRAAQGFSAQERVHRLVFSPDGRSLASAAMDGAILLWDLGGGPLPAPEDLPTPTPIP